MSNERNCNFFDTFKEENAEYVLEVCFEQSDYCPQYLVDFNIDKNIFFLTLAFYINNIALIGLEQPEGEEVEEEFIGRCNFCTVFRDENAEYNIQIQWEQKEEGPTCAIQFNINKPVFLFALALYLKSKCCKEDEDLE